MKIERSINRNALIIATISFLLGTILLLLYLISESETLIDIGIFYVVVASALNATSFVGLAINTLINIPDYKENLITIVLVSINIPITIGYIIIILNNPFKNTLI